MIRRPVCAAIALALAGLLQHASAADTRRTYIVQLTDQPLASYAGTLAGMAATRPAGGKHITLDSAAARQYASYLAQKQTSVRAAVAGAPVLYQYSVVFNGFAARLTDVEAARLRARADVAAVTVDVARHVDTTYTAHFLGLDAPDGLWAQAGGAASAGEDVIIGVVDTGIWPGNPAFADRVDALGAPSLDGAATLAYGPAPAGWKGICQAGEAFHASDCNHKLIGAQYFNAAFLQENAAAGVHWSEFNSPRDSLGGVVGQGGHGSHTASTAAGNAGVAAIVGGSELGLASGMAPRARLAAYKVCWTANDAQDAAGRNTCSSADSVAAIEQAVRDGVNVLNFSISGGDTVEDVVEIAFLHAANAGVFIAASAGNSGPAPVVAHVSPWLTTVAASTHNRSMTAAVTLGNGASYTGASLNAHALAASALVRAEDAGLADADSERLALCYSASANGGVGVLDPAKVAGKIVSCTRGSNARVDKSAAVAEAGGVGMVLIDNGGGLVADVHAVPTVHVGAADGAAIAAYAQAQAQARPSAAIGRFAVSAGATPAPVVAAFSSRGPNGFDPNLLKPDVSAPGVDIIAAVAPGLSTEQRSALVAGSLAAPNAWDIYSGTSMASPHVAGIAALLHQLHPGWSPTAIKSALMTSAADTLPDQLGGEQRGVLPWGQGAGQVKPGGAHDPGLVFDAGATDYAAYRCAMGAPAACAGAGSGVATYQLNMPSITVGNVLGTTTVRRALTNVGAAAAAYTASVEIDGFSAVVTPSTLAFAPGATLPFSVALRRTTAAPDSWQYGKLVWSDGVHQVRVPVSVRAGPAIAAPAVISAELASATRVVGISTGYSGALTVHAAGLTEVTRSAMRVMQAPRGSVDTIAQDVDACLAGAAGVRVAALDVPAGSAAASVELFERDSAGGSDDDLDVVVLAPDGALAGISMNAGSNERVLLAAPAPGSYRVCVIGYALADGVSGAFTLSTAVAGAADRGGALRALAPPRVDGGGASIGVSWTGLADGKRYLGALQLFDDARALAATTVLQVSTDHAAPLAPTVARAPRRDDGR